MPEIVNFRILVSCVKSETNKGAVLNREGRNSVHWSILEREHCQNLSVFTGQQFHPPASRQLIQWQSHYQLRMRQYHISFQIDGVVPINTYKAELFVLDWSTLLKAQTAGSSFKLIWNSIYDCSPLFSRSHKMKLQLWIRGGNPMVWP